MGAALSRAEAHNQIKQQRYHLELISYAYTVDRASNVGRNK